jgi:hypothetical protein
MKGALTCRDETRRQEIRRRSHNGIDYVDVAGTRLCVHFLTDIPPEFLSEEKGHELNPTEKNARLRHIAIRGGRRITDLHAVDFDAHASDDTFQQDCLGITLNREGDFSTYTLCFVELDEEGRPTERPLQSLDPRYACIDLSFKIDCPAEIDCKSDAVCPPPERPRPEVNYLAKDYASFRQLILDRLSLVMPDWRERHVPDIGIAIVELLAYAGDYLSYYQDSVATEAYLDTARQRISVRRHARLVDYRMHDGCNARAFVALTAAADGEIKLRDLYFVTRFDLQTQTTVVREFELAKAKGWLAFEPLSERETFALWRDHNEIRIYTWGDRECCIPKGATRATLVDGFIDEPEPEPPYPPPPPPDPYEARKRKRSRYKEPEPYPEPYPPPPKERKRKLRLHPGDFLLFEELACAGTVFLTKEKGDGGFDPYKPSMMPDADRTHRHVVRLTKVTPLVDPLNGAVLLDVEWDRQDAMPFPLCISAIGIAPECDYVEPLAVARGNVLLTDHGRTLTEPLDPPREEHEEEICEGEDDPSEIGQVARRYRPVLKNAPLTFAQPLTPDAPASVLLRQDPRAAMPAVTLQSDSPRIHGREPHETWTARYDLLDSDGGDLHFVAEVDDDGHAHLRFGDGDAGRPVELGMTFAATYRIGNGRAGLVGPEAIVHVVVRGGGTSNLIFAVRNPLPSSGAAEPEPVIEVKMRAPAAFRKDLQRAITGDDYATLAQFVRNPERNPRVQGAAGALVWSGSWYEAGVAIDPLGASELEPALRDSISASLERYRRMGHDLRVEPARYVPLRLDLTLCVKPHYLRAHVLAAVRNALSNRVFPDGRRGLFHPDNLLFGESVYISRIVAAVMAVDGVAEVEVTRLERIAEPPLQPPKPPATGVLVLRPNEIARLDNDPANPENGILSFSDVRGGR